MNEIEKTNIGWDYIFFEMLNTKCFENHKLL